MAKRRKSAAVPEEKKEYLCDWVRQLVNPKLADIKNIKIINDDLNNISQEEFAVINILKIHLDELRKVKNECHASLKPYFNMFIFALESSHPEHFKTDTIYAQVDQLQYLVGNDNTTRIRIQLQNYYRKDSIRDILSFLITSSRRLLRVSLAFFALVQSASMLLLCLCGGDYDTAWKNLITASNRYDNEDHHLIEYTETVDYHDEEFFTE